MTPFYGWGSTVSRLRCHFEEAVYFLPLFTTKPPSGFEYGIPGLGIQRLNHQAITPYCCSVAPDSIPVAVLKNCEPELCYMQAELFNMCLKESCFPDSWKVSSVVSVFKNVGERSAAKNYHPVSLLSVVSKNL